MVNSAERPLPRVDLRQVGATFDDVLMMLGQLVAHRLLEVGGAGTERRHAINHIYHQVIAVEIVAHHHVERRGGRAFLLVAAHVQVGVIAATIGEPVNQPRIAVVGKDHRFVGGEQRIEAAAAHTVRMLVLGLQGHQVDHVDHADLEPRQMFAQQSHRRQRLQGRHVAGKQKAPQWLDMDAAIKHCEAGIGIWTWASTDDDGDPDVVLAAAGDVPTLETLAAVALLREHLPGLKVRMINVVDLMTLQPENEHPHGLNDRDFDTLFTADKPVIFAYHGYPWLIHRLTYRRRNHANLHVRGYKEEGSTTTPFDMVVRNDLDRYHLVIDVIDRVPTLGSRAAHLKQAMRDKLRYCCARALADRSVNAKVLKTQQPTPMMYTRNVQRRRPLRCSAVVYFEL